MSEQAHALLVGLLSQLRADFDRLRWQASPVRAQLVHRATNAEAEGVLGIPSLPSSDVVAFQGAGHREAQQLFDESGNPRFREDPIVDVKGTPITNSAGEAFDVVMPAFRTITFSGRIEDYQQLAQLAERGGRIVGSLRLPVLDRFQGWRFSTPSDLWWSVLFEIAWQKEHPLLVAEKRLWLPAKEPHAFVPYDLQQLKHLASSGLGGLDKIPGNWLKRLPEAWVSNLENAVAASLDGTELMISKLTPATPLTDKAASGEGPMDIASTTVKIGRRFAVALSFPGERRDFVAKVAFGLREVFGEQRVFYDRFHEVELSRPNLDLVLQQFYSQDSDLVIVFVCGEYDEKEWCGLEWRAIRELMKTHSRADEDVMFLRFDNKPLPGMLSIDGFLDISRRSERDVIDAILRRWSATR